jgi:AraC family transcriptional regulator, transcriptional activator of pobA
MKKEEINHFKFESISDAHRFFNLPMPKHPLISIINGQTTLPVPSEPSPYSHVLGFYKISYKPKTSGKLRYGQTYYDFDEGGLLFASPNQVIGNNDDAGNNPVDCSRYTLLIHPDFLWNHPLAKKIRQYGFFSYTANEALHLSEEEVATITSIFKMIEHELNSRIDDFSQDIVVAQIELLLNFANRFYKRQFITRKVANSDMLQKLEDVLNNYFNSEISLSQGLPTVQFLAEHVNLSPSYLSDMLRSQTGQNAQQYIHIKLIEKAKEILSTTNLSVSEVAYTLGFEHPQSFSKLFKSKTNLSPLEFRKSFN